MSLIMHNCHAATMEEIAAVKCPKATKTWKPIPHKEAIDLALEVIEGCGLKVTEMRFALSGRKSAGGKTRLFGEILVAGKQEFDWLTMALGIRSSIDKTLTYGCACGESVCVCGNLCFFSEFMEDHKHTCVGESRFKEKMKKVVDQYIEKFADRIEQIKYWQGVEITEQQVNDLIMRCFRAGAFGCNLIPHIIEAWEKPKYDDFKPRTVWSLHNAYTEAHKHRSGDPIRNAEGSIIATQMFKEVYPKIEAKN